MTEYQRFGIVWQICDAGGDLADRYFVSSYRGYLPFFVWGEDLNALEGKKRLELREEHLLKGILYGLYEYEYSPKPWHQQQDRNTMLHLLGVLQDGFHFDNREQMVLNVAANVRGLNGTAASRIMLEAGNLLEPQSSKIKSDLISDLWAVVSEQGTDEAIFKEILDLVGQIDLSQLHSDAKQVVCYYGFCALTFLEKYEEMMGYLECVVYPNITMQPLKKRIKDLLETPGTAISPSDLRVV